ncbi:hypothetical protein E0F15_04525 [Frankia sp. B2]|uniref:hypothetical protein n=1 Tax=unclassified Frankia TaxID=2632575 RepID=UPI000A9CB12C|nr:MULTISPECIES: hypothetical protein [unclassified Frankia]TFE33708.1 hypothetical protein E0F15_04525 [Frankia sp. B2]
MRGPGDAPRRLDRPLGGVHPVPAVPAVPLSPTLPDEAPSPMSTPARGGRHPAGASGRPPAAAPRAGSA